MFFYSSHTPCTRRLQSRYRDLSANLKAYSALNNLPPELKETMQEHLRLSFSSSEASDDQVCFSGFGLCAGACELAV